MVKLVEKSTQQYLAVQEKLSQMTALLHKGQTTALVRVQQEWHKLNAEAQDTDRQINTILQSCQPSDEVLAQLDKRKQTMLQIKQQCEKLRQQARTLQALTTDELHRLKKGRTAIGGYRSSNQGGGHSTLGSC